MSVHHEMLCPLGANVLLAETLMKKVNDQSLKEYVRSILISSKLVLLNVNDLLDQNIIQCGRFEPFFKNESVRNAVFEIVQTLRWTLERRNILIELQFPSEFDLMLAFDKRRL